MAAAEIICVMSLFARLFATHAYNLIACERLIGRRLGGSVAVFARNWAANVHDYYVHRQEIKCFISPCRHHRETTSHVVMVILLVIPPAILPRKTRATTRTYPVSRVCVANARKKKNRRYAHHLCFTRASHKGAHMLLCVTIARARQINTPKERVGA